MNHWLHTHHALHKLLRAGPILVPIAITLAVLALLASAPTAFSQVEPLWPPHDGPSAGEPSVNAYLPLVCSSQPQIGGEYALLGWNDLGMHCYNADFRDLAVLPPYNTLWTQVIRRGDPPVIVTSGVTATYVFTDNTYSVGKSNFWTYANQLFGVNLPPDIGLTGRGLSGEFERKADHFAADGIPLTEFSDSAPTRPDPYQLALVSLFGPDGHLLASNTVVAPVSTEMHCDNCHFDGGVEDIATGRVETNILTLHDEENAEEYPTGHTGNLMDRRPVLCAECHASNALGAPGVSGIPNLSRAMHSEHRDKVAQTTEGCYNCHPGPQTQCLRDVMASEHGMGCVDCHGTMRQVAQNPNPWLNEPRCDTCHTDPAYAQNAALYRESTGHGGVYCAGCHDSPHAIAPSSQPRDGLKFINLQGHEGPLDTCTVCHLTQPTGGGPHSTSGE